MLDLSEFQLHRNCLSLASHSFLPLVSSYLATNMVLLASPDGVPNGGGIQSRAGAPGGPTEEQKVLMSE